MIPPVASRSRRSAPVPRQILRRAAFAASVIAMIVTVGPTTVFAADPSPAPDRGGIVAVIPERTADRGVAINPVPSGTIGVRSSVGYLYGDNTVAVVGEVFNNTTTRRGVVRIEVRYYNASDVQIGVHEESVVLDRVARSSLGPFLLYDTTPPPIANIASYRIRTRASVAVTAPPVGALHLLNATSSIVNIPDFGDVRRFEGTIRNPNGFAVNGVTTIVTAYDASGDVLDVTYGSPSGGTLAAGESAPYVMDLAVSDNPELVFHHAGILADGVRSGGSAYVTSWANYFDDLGPGTFRNDVIWLAEQGITSGCAPGRFCPTAAVRRDEMASFLSRALDLPPTTTDYFDDDDGRTHEANINRLAAARITGGCGPRKYCPASYVHRDAMASFLSRALELPPTTTNYFTDDNGNTHEPNINRLKAAGITGGCGGTKYCPTANVTRGQMAAFLHRAFQ